MCVVERLRELFKMVESVRAKVLLHDVIRVVSPSQLLKEDRPPLAK